MAGCNQITITIQMQFKTMQLPGKWSESKADFWMCIAIAPSSKYSRSNHWKVKSTCISSLFPKLQNDEKTEPESRWNFKKERK